MNLTKFFQPKNLTPQHYFWLFCLAHTLLWTIALWLSRPNPPFDTVESVAWGWQWQLGYDKHPPLAAWLSGAITKLLPSIDFSLYLLSGLSVVICFWAIWRLGQKFLSPTAALLSVLVLEGIYYYNISAAQFNPNVLMLPLWALTTLYFYQALTTQKNRDWLLLGLCAGLAVLAKYESFLLLFVMTGLLLGTTPGRRSFTRPGIYLATLVFVLIVLPNLIWLWQNDFISFAYTTERTTNKTLQITWLNHLYQPLRYLGEQFTAILPVLLLFWPFYRAKTQPQSSDPFTQQFIWVMGLGPFVIVFLLSLLTGAWIHSLWAFPFFSLMGILLFNIKRPEITSQQIKKFLYTFIPFFLLLIVARTTFLVAGPYFQHKINSAHFPGKMIAATLTADWHQHFQQPLKYVAGHRTLVEHITVYSVDHPAPYFEWSKKQSQWIDENKVYEQGALFVWFTPTMGKVNLPDEIATRFPQAQLQGIYYFHSATSAPVDKVAVGVAYLPPKAFKALGG
jgi:4-amino-4-deoxy-L-arabinose transferase-like glycosyltransferase